MNKPAVGFRLRAFTTLLVVIGFTVLLLSGAVLFLSPPGRIANWTQWQILGLTKRAWSDLHIAFSALFLVAGITHLAFNWRPMLQHLGARLSGRRGFRPEWVVALGVGGGLFAATRAQVPPVSNLIAWSEQLRSSWENDTKDRAPLPHAELLTLRELAAQAGASAEEAVRRLEAAGVRGVLLDAQVQRLADTTGLTPARVYDIIRAKSPSGERDPANPSPRGAGGGGGPGWKTLRQFCSEEGLDLAAAQSRLAARGFRSTPEQTLREIAVNNGFERPYALLEILRQK